MIEAIDFEKESIEFAYKPSELNEFYYDVCLNTEKYSRGNQFISKYNSEKIIEMLKGCSARQISIFREILFVVYRNAYKNEFIEADIEALRKIKEMAELEKDKNDSWDKILFIVKCNYYFPVSLAKIRNFFPKFFA